jgi:hypothetical protein
MVSVLSMVSNTILPSWANQPMLRWMIFSSSGSALTNVATGLAPCSDKYCQMLPAVNPTRSNGDISPATATGLDATTGAFLGVFAGWLSFMIWVSVANGDSVLALGTGLAVMAFGFDGVLGVGLVLVALASDAAVAEGCLVFDLGTSFSLGVVGFFIMTLRSIRVKTKMRFQHFIWVARNVLLYSQFYASFGEYVKADRLEILGKATGPT